MRHSAPINEPCTSPAAPRQRLEPLPGLFSGGLRCVTAMDVNAKDSPELFFLFLLIVELFFLIKVEKQGPQSVKLRR